MWFDSPSIIGFNVLAFDTFVFYSFFFFFFRFSFFNNLWFIDYLFFTEGFQFIKTNFPGTGQIITLLVYLTRVASIEPDFTIKICNIFFYRVDIRFIKLLDAVRLVLLTTEQEWTCAESYLTVFDVAFFTAIVPYSAVVKLVLSNTVNIIVFSTSVLCFYSHAHVGNEARNNLRAVRCQLILIAHILRIRLTISGPRLHFSWF